MSSNQDFYVTLPSNTHAGTKIGNYYVQLPTKLLLPGTWEVGMVSIIYPYSWKNLPSQIEPGTHMGTTTIFFRLYNGTSVAVNLHSGYYSTVEDLITMINSSVKKTITKYMEQTPEDQFIDFHDQYKFSYDPVIKRVTITIDKTYISEIELSQHLQFMLGFSNRIMFETEQQAMYRPDLDAGRNLIYVYSDIVEPQMVGTSRVPLLRIVHVKGEHGNSIEKLFYAPQYLPVVSKEISRINIELKFGSGQLIDFNSGQTVVTLHFRRKRVLLQ